MEIIQQPSPEEIPVTLRSMLLARGPRAIGITARFFLGQGALQGAQLFATLFLIRSLSVESYAQFGLAYAFQISMGSLMDLGFTTTIIPLVGEHRDDRRLVGRYVRAAKYWRDRTFWILAPFAAISFFAIMHQHPWNWETQVALALSVLLALYSSGRVSYFSAPMLLFSKLGDYYTPQTLTTFGRVIAYVVCWFVGTLSGWIAAGLTAINVTANSFFFEMKSRQYMEWPETDDPTTNREVLRYIIPATPALIFAAFQAQISLFLVSIFGRTTNIAEVAALGKLGQLFSVFMTFTIVVVEPYVARLSRARLLSHYVSFVAITAVVCIPVVLLAFVIPAPFLWLLGGNYKGLGGSIGWVVLTACIMQLASLMWIMNRSRKWLFWSGSILEIVLILAVQVTFIAFVGVHTTQQAVFFSFASSFCYIVAHGYVAILGFSKSPRITSDSQEEATR